MIEFNVSELLKEPIGSKRAYALGETGPIAPTGEDSMHGLQGQMSFMRTDKGILAQAILESAITCNCSRCLSPYEQHVHIKLEEEFLPLIEVQTGAPNNLSYLEDKNNIIDKNHILDLTEPIRQHAVVAIPMMPLCNPDCAGICSRCGTNLNESQCKCAEVQRDPSWEPLMELLSQGKF